MIPKVRCAADGLATAIDHAINRKKLVGFAFIFESVSGITNVQAIAAVSPKL